MMQWMDELPTGLLYHDGEDYEVITLTDKGAIFKSPRNELIWIETAAAADVLLDDAAAVMDL